MDPKDVGIDSNEIILTARSGRAALKHRLQVLGVDLSDQSKLDKIYEEFRNWPTRRRKSTTTTF